MKKIHPAYLAILWLTAMGLYTAMQPAAADATAECRTEADYYGISPEQQEEYINGCLASRGETGLAPDVVTEDDTPQSEADDNPEVEAVNVYEAQ